MLLKKVLLIAVSALLFTSCSNDDAPIAQPLGDYENGILILNEGNFGTDNASISYLSNDLATLQNSAFSVVNPSVILGNTAQSITFYNDLAFVVLNGSNKIEVINRYTLKSVRNITTGLNNPRYVAIANNKAYITNWGDGVDTSDDYVAVLDLSNYSFSIPIPVVEGPEKIIENEGKLYVAHKGGYGFGNSISVIDAATNSVTSTVTVGDLPNSMEIVNNVLNVLCSGLPSWSSTETSGSLVRVNLATNVKTTVAFNGMAHPSNLVLEGNNFYYTENSGVYQVSATSTTMPSQPLFTTTPQGAYGIYSFAVRNGQLFLGDAGDYNSNGKIYVYTISGTVLKTATVGVIPTGFYFN